MNEKSVFFGVDDAERKIRKLSPRIVLVSTIEFIVHFVVVMSLLYIAALVFAYLEDDQPRGNSNVSIPPNQTSFPSKHRLHNSNGSLLWWSIYNDYGVSLTPDDLEVIATQVEKIGERNLKTEIQHGAQSHLKVQKWFYFVIIATTTIGYGDISPRTQNGRIFYVCFSIFGIILMMSLLKSCGEIITSIQRRSYRVFLRYIAKLLRLRCCSEELVSLISTALLFIAFLIFGLWHNSLDSNDHSMIDIIYFWIVSFTTVGFGDIGHTLEFEIEHAYELTVYRVFGLSLVAAFIDSICSCVALHSKTLKNETAVYQKKILETLQAGVRKSGLLKECANEDCSMEHAEGKQISPIIVMQHNETDVAMQ